MAEKKAKLVNRKTNVNNPSPKKRAPSQTLLSQLESGMVQALMERRFYQLLDAHINPIIEDFLQEHAPSSQTEATNYYEISNRYDRDDWFSFWRLRSLVWKQARLKRYTMEDIATFEEKVRIAMEELHVKYAMYREEWRRARQATENENTP